MSRIAKVTFLSCGLALATLAAYANDFENGFHFDDFHAVSNNLFIRDLHNIPRFFADAVYFSTLPAHRMYRPVVSSSLALDYRLGGGLKPFWFQLSTFTWYVVQVILVCFLFRHIMDSASPHRYNLRAALCYGLHPVKRRNRELRDPTRPSWESGMPKWSLPPSLHGPDGRFRMCPPD